MSSQLAFALSMMIFRIILCTHDRVCTKMRKSTKSTRKAKWILAGSVLSTAARGISTNANDKVCHSKHTVHQFVLLWHSCVRVRVENQTLISGCSAKQDNSNLEATSKSLIAFQIWNLRLNHTHHDDSRNDCIRYMRQFTTSLKIEIHAEIRLEPFRVVCAL